MVVDENLAITTAGGEDATTATAYRDDRDDLSSAASTSRAQGNQLGTGAAGEVVEVHPSEHAMIIGHDGCANGMNAIRLGNVRVGVRVDGAGGQIEKRIRDGRNGWRAHYRTPRGKQRNKTFGRKVDAERFLATVENAKNTGSYIDPALARVTVGEGAQLWLDGQTQVKPTTRERYEGVVRKHIRVEWSSVKLAAVTHADVQAWVTSLTKTQSPASVHKIHRVLSMMLDMTVRDAAAQVNLPRSVKHERRYLTHAQVDALAHACGYPAEVSKHRAHDERTHEMYRLVVLFLAYTDVRFGEMAALRVHRVDLGRHLAHREPDDLVFAGIRSGSPLRVSTFRKAFRPAAEAIGIPDLYPHEIRHTAASLAIASGADVKVVQQMLGHGSATMTLDTYGHFFETRLDSPTPWTWPAQTSAGQPNSTPRCHMVLPICCPDTFWITTQKYP